MNSGVNFNYAVMVDPIELLVGNRPVPGQFVHIGCTSNGAYTRTPRLIPPNVLEAPGIFTAVPVMGTITETVNSLFQFQIFAPRDDEVLVAEAHRFGAFEVRRDGVEDRRAVYRIFDSFLGYFQEHTGSVN